MRHQPDQPKYESIFGKALTLYKQAVGNVALLRYSWVLVATICILAFITYFQLKRSDVFLYALGVIVISFLAYVFSYFLKANNPVIQFAIYILVYTITIVTAGVIGTLGYSVVTGKFYLPNVLNEQRLPWQTPPAPDYTIKVDTSSIYTPYMILVENRSDLSETVDRMDWGSFEREIVYRWSYPDLVRLVYSRKTEIPVFFDTALCYRCHPDFRKPTHLPWQFINVYSHPEEMYRLWKDCMDLKDQQLMVRIIDMNRNPELYLKSKSS